MWHLSLFICYFFGSEREKHLRNCFKLSTENAIVDTCFRYTWTEMRFVVSIFFVAQCFFNAKCPRVKCQNQYHLIFKSTGACTTKNNTCCTPFLSGRCSKYETEMFIHFNWTLKILLIRTLLLLLLSFPLSVSARLFHSSIQSLDTWILWTMNNSQHFVHHFSHQLRQQKCINGNPS